MNTPDFIEPVIGVPLAIVLYLAWWLVERHARQATNHEIRRHDA